MRDEVKDSGQAASLFTACSADRLRRDIEEFSARELARELRRRADADAAGHLEAGRKLERLWNSPVWESASDVEKEAMGRRVEEACRRKFGLRVLASWYAMDAGPASLPRCWDHLFLMYAKGCMSKDAVGLMLETIDDIVPEVCCVENVMDGPELEGVEGAGWWERAERFGSRVGAPSSRSDEKCKRLLGL